MSLHTEYINYPDHLFVKASGDWTTENAFKLIQDVKSEADKQNTKHILIDLIDLSLPDNEMVRFYSGEKVAEIFGHRYKIATFSHPEHINNYSETVAVNRMARMKVFTDEDEARSWLLST